MNALHWDVLEDLSVRLRVYSFPQGMRRTEIRDRTNFRRFLKPLEAHGYVRQVVVMAKPVPEMREPLFASQNGIDPSIAFSKVLRLARARWAGLSAVPTRCVVATRRGLQLHNVNRPKLIAKPLQATHDLAVAQVFLVLQDSGQVDDWIGEDVARFDLGGKTLDAWLVRYAESIRKGVEIVGEQYTENKIMSIHRECHERGLGYELW